MNVLYFGIGETEAVNVTAVLTPLGEASESFFAQLDAWREETFGEIIKVSETPEGGYVFETGPWNAEDDSPFYRLTGRAFDEAALAEIAFSFSRFVSETA